MSTELPHSLRVWPRCSGSIHALPFETPADAQDIQKVLGLMEEHIIGETNTIYERYNFQRRQQEDNEAIDQYVTALRTLARTCSFGTNADERL